MTYNNYLVDITIDKSYLHTESTYSDSEKPVDIIFDVLFLSTRGAVRLRLEGFPLYRELRFLENVLFGDILLSDIYMEKMVYMKVKRQKSYIYQVF